MEIQIREHHHDQFLTQIKHQIRNHSADKRKVDPTLIRPIYELPTNKRSPQ